ncbi:MAG: hypothetical protein ACT4QA_16935 [Panacagrimonas sp.]
MPAHAAESLTALYAAVPAPPGDLATASSWVRDGRIAAAEMLSIEARLLNQKSASGGTSTATAVHTRAEAPQDSPEVLACVAAYKTYLAANLGTNEPAQVLGRRLSSLVQGFARLKLRTSKPDLLQDIRKQELASYGALFADWKVRREPVIDRAQREISAAGEAGSIGNAENRMAVQQYRRAMIIEIEALLGVTRQAVESAAGISAAPAPTPGRGPSTLWDMMSGPTKNPS